MAQLSDDTPRHRASAARSAKPRGRDDASRGAVMSTSGVSRRTASVTRRAQKHAGKNSKRPGEQHSVPLVAFAVVAVLVFGVAAYLARGLFKTTDTTPHVQPGLEVNISIPEGAGGSEIAEILLENGVISDTSEFFREVKSQEAEMSLQSGSYSFITGANTHEVVMQLVTGPNSTDDLITIPEGYSVRQIAAVCEETLEIPADEFMAQAVASNYVNDYPFLVNVENDSLEGYLFPKTYDFGGKDKSADAVIRTMLNQYQTEVSSLDFANGLAALNSKYGVDFDEYDVLTMASIIEKEAFLDDERVKVSSVFYNRLRDWMPLQSDATIGYVLDHEVTAEDLEIDDPYNTYLYQGVTPTPICNPGFESIKAALYPADTNYFYFFIIDDGTYSLHAFSETYEQHLKAIDQAVADQAVAADQAAAAEKQQ